MNGFELFDHTADACVLARGESMGDAFAQAALGMFSVMTDPERTEPKEVRDVETKAPDRESLPVTWLNNLICLFATGDSDQGDKRHAPPRAVPWRNAGPVAKGTFMRTSMSLYGPRMQKA